LSFPKISSVKNKTDREAYNGCCPCGHRDSPVCLRVYNGHNQLPKIILGIKFSDGIDVVRSQAQTAAA